MFVGYSDQHKAYRFLDVTTNSVKIKDHMLVDESARPFQSNPDLKFVDNDYFEVKISIK